MEERDISKLMSDLENLDKNMRFARKEKEWERERAALHSLVIALLIEMKNHVDISGKNDILLQKAKNLGIDF